MAGRRRQATGPRPRQALAQRAGGLPEGHGPARERAAHPRHHVLNPARSLLARSLLARSLLAPPPSLPCPASPRLLARSAAALAFAHVSVLSWTRYPSLLH